MLFASYNLILFYNRSKEFRPSYGHLQEIRAFIPPATPYMACTATATRDVYKEVILALEMRDSIKISVSPNRPNIFYQVKIRTEIESDFSDMVSSLRANLINTPRVIVYCQSLDKCSALYAHFLHELGPSSYYPPGAPHLSDYRLFGMFHSGTPQYNKDIILKSLVEREGVVRVVFATVALGMGVNFHTVNSVIHYGAPSSIDDYFQESGRAGRSGDPAKSTVYWKRRDCPVRKEPITTHHDEVIAVREYLENVTSCRRKWLLAYFDPGCAKLECDPLLCCDICAASETGQQDM